MNGRRIFVVFEIAVVVFLSFTITVRSQSKQEQSQVQPTRDGVTAEISQSPSFRVKIAPNLPELTIKVIPEMAPDEDGTKLAMVHDIEVFRGDAHQALQHLTGCDWSSMETPSQGAEWMSAEDINFDGYKDIYVMTWWGATGNQGGCRWLYNPSTGHFDFNKEFSELAGCSVNPATKTILSFSTGGAAGMVHDAVRYRVEHNKPVAVWHEHQDLDASKNQFHCVVEERKGDKMTMTLDKWGTPGSDGPCDPGEIFR